MNTKMTGLKRPPVTADKDRHGRRRPTPGGRYAYIPAGVRYDPNLCVEAKLLYGEMTALCTTPGRCRIESGREARVYKTTEKKIHQLLVSLQGRSHIRIVVPRDIHLKEPCGIYKILLTASVR
jgi:hypothetical protein